MAALAQGGVSNLSLGRVTTFTHLAPSGIAATDVGKPVKLSGNETVAQCADGDMIHGVIERFEDRVQEGIKVASIQVNGVFDFPLKASDTLAAGDFVVAAGSGEVKKAGSGVYSTARCLSVVSGVARVYLVG